MEVRRNGYRLLVEMGRWLRSKCFEKSEEREETARLEEKALRDQYLRQAKEVRSE